MITKLLKQNYSIFHWPKKFFYSTDYIFLTCINNIISISEITWDELRIAKSVLFQKFNISIFAILRSVQNPK
jgi:hypothetical protein